MKILRTGVLLILLSVLLVVVGGAIGGQNGLKIALAITVLLNGISYFFSDKIALASSGAQRVSREQVPRLYEVMERLAAKAGLPMPNLYVIPEAAPNAFATGRNPQHASVAVTQGLLELPQPRRAVGCGPWRMRWAPLRELHKGSASAGLPSRRDVPSLRKAWVPARARLVARRWRPERSCPKKNTKCRSTKP